MKIVITVEGGIVESVIVDVNHILGIKDIDVAVVDFDTDMMEDEETVEVEQYGVNARAHISQRNVEINRDAVKRVFKLL